MASIRKGIRRLKFKSAANLHFSKERRNRENYFYVSNERRNRENYFYSEISFGGLSRLRLPLKQCKFAADLILKSLNFAKN